MGRSRDDEAPHLEAVVMANPSYFGVTQFMLAFPGDMLTPQTVQPYLSLAVFSAAGLRHLPIVDNLQL